MDRAEVLQLAQHDPIWQATRENVERLTGVRDWAEAFFATAVVFEPLVGKLFRSGLVMQAAAKQLQPIWSQLPEKLGPRVFGLDTPKELSA